MHIIEAVDAASATDEHLGAKGKMVDQKSYGSSKSVRVRQRNKSGLSKPVSAVTVSRLGVDMHLC